jgi:CTP:molybdopterin cytidylyltransferase MocA
VYHSRRPAEERVKELEAKGFEVEIGPWYRQKEMHWLLVKGDTPLLDPQVAHKLAIVDGENPAQGSATGLPVASRRNCAPVWSRTP